MTDGSHPQQNSANNTPNGYPWQPPDSPIDNFEELLRPLSETNDETIAPYAGQPIYPPEGYQYNWNQSGEYETLPTDFSYEVADEDLKEEPASFTGRSRQKRNTRGRVVAVVQDGQPKSRRAEKRAHILFEHGSVSATDKPRGLTRMKRGVLEWYNPDRLTFHPAAPLDHYRRQIISEDNALGHYDYEADRGLDANDVTTFPQDDTLGQKRWNVKDRHSWGNIQDEDGNQVMYLVEKPDRDIETPEPGFMVYDNLIMLDPDSNPIIAWPGIPRLMSSNMEGGRIEALRRIYPWLSLPQFRARMPRTVTRKTVGVQPLFGLSSLQQRLTRFREAMDVPPWKKLQISRGSDLSKYTRERLSQEGLDPNSTAGLDPLSRKEVLKRKKPYLGSCPENAGIYTLTEEEKQEKAAREAARYEEVQTRKQRVDQSNGLLNSSSVAKRKREVTTDMDLNLQPARKQLRSSSRPANISHPSLLTSASNTTRLRPRYGFSNTQLDSTRRSDIESGIADPGEAAKIIASQATVEYEVFRDLRWVAPQTIFDRVSIRAALQYTVADYQHHHSTEPATTTSTDPYFEQYRQIQNQHEQVWSLTGMKAPQLIYVGEWYDSFQSVPLPPMPEEALEHLLPSHEESREAESEATSDHTLDFSQSFDYDKEVDEEPSLPAPPINVSPELKGAALGEPAVGTPKVNDVSDQERSSNIMKIGYIL